MALQICLQAGGVPRACLRHAPTRALPGSSGSLCSRLPAGKPLGLRAARPRARSAPEPAASFLGVGAPEAILVGVVALVVFGPKGLAQAAKSLGATLRAFAPTLRELTSVSQELKSSLEQEIGLDEIRAEFNPRPVPRVPPAADPASSSPQAQGSALSDLAADMQSQQMRPVDEAQAAAIDPDIQRKRAESASAAWGSGGGGAAAPSSSGGGGSAGAAAAPQAKGVQEMSVDELEAELARRRGAVAAGQLPPQLGSDD